MNVSFCNLYTQDVNRGLITILMSFPTQWIIQVNIFANLRYFMLKSLSPCTKIIFSTRRKHHASLTLAIWSVEQRASELHSSIHVIRAYIREYVLTATSLKSHAKLSPRIHDDAAQLTGDVDDVERFLIIPLLRQFFVDFAVSQQPD